jgi:hypothetical protein
MDAIKLEFERFQFDFSSEGSIDVLIKELTEQLINIKYSVNINMQGVVSAVIRNCGPNDRHLQRVAEDVLNRLETRSRAVFSHFEHFDQFGDKIFGYGEFHVLVESQSWALLSTSEYYKFHDGWGPEPDGLNLVFVEFLPESAVVYPVSHENISFELAVYNTYREHRQWACKMSAEPITPM